MADNDEDDTVYCSICGAELSDFERECGETICDNCKASMILNDDIYPSLGDF